MPVFNCKPRVNVKFYNGKTSVNTGKQDIRQVLTNRLIPENRLFLGFTVMGKYRTMERILNSPTAKQLENLGFSDRWTPVNVSKCHILRKFTARFLQGKRHLFCHVIIRLVIVYRWYEKFASWIKKNHSSSICFISIALFLFSPDKTRVSCFKLCEENKSNKLQMLTLKRKRLLFQRITEFKMDEIQRRTPQ